MKAFLGFRKRVRWGHKGSAAAIDIDHLTKTELVELTTRIFTRLKCLAGEQASQDMLQFNIGDRVTFEAPRKGSIEGTLTRYNKKTVTIKTDDGQRWNVAPFLLSKIAPPQQ